jgi:hypothetical protein
VNRHFRPLKTAEVARESWTVPWNSAHVFSTEVFPRAARYKLGDASLADMLQKRRDWNATQTSYLQALRDVHETWRTVWMDTTDVWGKSSR